MGARERTGQTGKRQPYRCFLIRCRLEESALPGASPGSSPGAGPDGALAWRFTVQQADANAPRRTFVSLQEVAAHLEAELAFCALDARGQEPTRSHKE